MIDPRARIADRIKAVSLIVSETMAAELYPPRVPPEAKFIKTLGWFRQHGTEDGFIGVAATEGRLRFLAAEGVVDVIDHAKVFESRDELSMAAMRIETVCDLAFRIEPVYAKERSAMWEMG